MDQGKSLTALLAVAIHVKKAHMDTSQDYLTRIPANSTIRIETQSKLKV